MEYGILLLIRNTRSDMSLEKAVLKVARQINAYDEASLMALWERLAERVSRFEPTTEWEEAALALSIVQAVRMKNQLFNHHLAESRRTPPDHGVDLAALTVPTPGASRNRKGSPRDAGQSHPAPERGDADAVEVGHKGGKLLQFKPRKK
jgi:hypothetical protein